MLALRRILVTALIAATASVCAQAPATSPAEGAKAPDFKLQDQKGEWHTLKQYKGKWVVLYFYPKDFTSGCTVEAHNFQRDQAEFAKRNAVVLGVSGDSDESHKKFCAKEGLNFKLLADTSHEVSRQYGSLMNFGLAKVSARHTFLIDPAGKIARAFMSVNPMRHSAEMLAAIDEAVQVSGFKQPASGP